MNLKSLFAAIILAVAVAPASQAQTTVSEDFTQSTTTNQWFFLYGACLTAGNSTATASPGIVPSCNTILTNYYNKQTDGDKYLVGGASGYLGSSTAPSGPSGQIADPAGSGALRFTNGSPYGHFERGAIVSAGQPFPTSSGVQITFKAVTYYGDGGGTGKDGADGISFYLLDGCMPLAGGVAGTNSGVPAQPTCPDTNPIYGYSTTSTTTTQTFAPVGATGGSLAYSCSNQNWPADGLAGAYLGLGIDEFGNFLNGYKNTLGEQNTSSTETYGDNTATGGYYQPGRIGLRGAGNITWQALNNAYGTWTSATAPFYPAAMLTDSTCYVGSFDSTLNACFQCASGTYSATTHACVVTSGTAPNPTAGATQAEFAVRQTCETGNLYNYNPNNSSLSSTYNYSTATGTNKPVAVTTATLTTGTATPPAVNTKNPAGILDYAAIGSTTSDGATTGYSVLTTPIANESAKTRGAATPILYNLKITQDGLLSLSFQSGNSTVATPVITNQSIIASNGNLPATFRFGFAGSTGGDTNIHEILCFKATPVETSNGSGGVSVYQNPTIKTGTQVYFAYYFPSDWTGQLTGQSVLFNNIEGTPNFDQVVISTIPNWDARCVLTVGKCTSTGTTTTTSTVQGPSNRVMITWDPTAATGIPFEWASLSTTMQNQLNFGDSSANLSSPNNQQRLNYLRGDRTQEIATASNGTTTGRFRARDSVLGDIVDSSPTWVGPPNLPYSTMSSWVDDLYAGAQPETAYSEYVTAEQNRTNVVYVGANDGFLHGFRAGTEDVNGNTIETNNDGHEVLAYMPGALLQSAVLTTCPASTTETIAQNIHGVTPANAACVPATTATSLTANLDYSNTQYAHNWFVDATPATGDVYYPQTGTTGWHTWMVGGLGAGGAVIYALNITDPANFAESKAAYNASNPNGILVGEWTPSNITCNISCANNLGNTFGTPQIRRFHNGQWGAIIGNGIGSKNGTAGIFIMLISNSGVPSFIYLPTGSTATGNGIVEAAAVDIDGDHIADYIYAGDLKGNLWRFDVTSNLASNWGSPFLLFTTPGGAAQPITTRVTIGTLKTITTTTNAAGAVLSNGPERIMINFGTGQMTPPTVLAGAVYATGPQYLFGVWDWNMGTSTAGWNFLSPGQQALSLTSAPPTSAISPTNGNMQVQTITAETPTVTTSTTTNGVTTTSTTTGTRSVSHNTICFVSDTSCTGGTSLGWYLQLPDTAGTGSNEQVIFDPALSPDGEFTVNTYVPAVNTALSCTVSNPTGWSMGLDPVSGAGSPTAYFSVGGVAVDGVQLNGTGTPSFVYSGQAADSNAEYFITQASSNGGVVQPTKVNSTTIVTGQRLNWIQRR